MHTAIRRAASIVLALLLLATGCAAPPASTGSTGAAPTLAPTSAATSAPATPHYNAVSADAAAPQDTASAAPEAAEAPPEPADAAPLPTPSILDVAAQEAAMLPDFAFHLGGAPAWDRYVITATLIPETNTVPGAMQVEVHNREDVPYEELYFRLYPNHVDFGGSLEVDDKVQVGGQVVTVSTEQNGVLMRVGLPAPLAPGEHTTVTLRFVARTPRLASGRHYGAFNQEAGVWSLASFYPVLARRFPDGWDRRPVISQGDLAVTETALYDVRIDAPPDMTLVATGVEVERMQLDHGPRRTRFVSGPQRDFFLAGLRGLAQASTVVDGTRIISYYQQDDPATGQRSLEVAAQSLRIFNEQFGPYPLQELEIVQAALTRFLGVEYPGVVLIEQGLYNQGGRDLDTTVSHEVAHQWWYSLVGNDVQGEPWLDEGLTSYTQVLYYEGLGDAQGAEGELQRFRAQYGAVRGTSRDGPIGGPVDSFRGNYVALVYAKGALFFHALRLRMGDETFNQFLQNYYGGYRYGEASGPGMLEVAEATCNCDLQPLYDEWVHQPTVSTVP